MEYRCIGNTGLKVSVFGLGTMNFTDPKRKDNYTELIRKSYECGINYFDTSEAYSNGISEELLGSSLKALNLPRENIVISTKIFYGKGFGHPHSNQLVNSLGLSRKHIIESTMKTLKSLQTEYIDIAFCHRYDLDTPLEETCRAMNWLIEQGKICYWGTCEWEVDEIIKAIRLCEGLGLIPPSVEQIHYNYFEREKLELKYKPLLNEGKRGICVWSILGGPSLGEGSPIGMGDRRNSLFEAKVLTKSKRDLDYEFLLKGLKCIANDLNLTLHEFAIAWSLKHPDISCGIMGWRKVIEMEESLDALSKIPFITKEVEIKVNDLLKNCPQGEFDWKIMANNFQDKRMF